MELIAIKENLNIYSGLNLIYRCLLLAKIKKEMCCEFYKMALDECLKNNFIELYKFISNEITTSLEVSGLTKEQEQFIMTKNKNTINSKLAEIQNYKNLKKPLSVRLSYYELGNIYFGQGCLKEAMETFYQAKDYNPTDIPLLDIAFQVKKIHLLLRVYDEKKSITVKDTGYPENANDDLKNCYWQLKILDAINSIMQKDFSFGWKILKEQMKYFEDCEELRKFTSLRDIADYYLVLNFMHCDRNESMKNFQEETYKKILVFSNEAFKVVESFQNFDFEILLENINKIFNRLEYDLYLSDVWKSMSDSVIEKLMLQYLVPFKQISMKQVAGTFGMNQSFCNQMIIKMIKQNTIPFLIDSINNNLVYYSQEKDKKVKLFKKGVKTIENYLNNKLLGLLRMRLNEIARENKKSQAQENMDVEDFYDDRIGMHRFAKNFQDNM